jgi:hypothetical protein
LPDAVHVAQYLVVPETENAVPLAAHEIVAPRIVRACVGVLPAIDFDDEHRFQADKVGDVGTDADLAPEFVAVELAETKVLPELTLGVRHVLTKTSCTAVGHDAAAPLIPTFPHKGGRGFLL